MNGARTIIALAAAFAILGIFLAMPAAPTAPTVPVAPSPAVPAAPAPTVPVAPAPAQRVAVTIPPLAYIVDRIGGDRTEVLVMVPKGADPHAWEPRPRQMADLAKSNLYVTAGIGLEAAWLARLTAGAGGITVLHAETVVEDAPAEAASHRDEHRNTLGNNARGDQDHSHDSLEDPHFWTSPPLVKAAAALVRDELAALDPAGAAAYRARYDVFAVELDRLDADLRARFVGDRGRAFMVFHPSWGHFAAAYGLEQVAIEVEGKQPRPRDLARFVDIARERNIRIIFVQPQFPERSARAVADAVHARLELVDPLAYDIPAAIRNTAAVIEAAFSEE